MQEILRDAPSERDWRRIRPVLDDAMHELSESDRLAVLLRFFENRELRAVGAALGLSENAARMRVERALDKLCRQLAKRGVTPATAALAAALAGQAVAAAPAGLTASVVAASLTTATIATASTLGILQLMASTKVKLAIATLVVAGVATPLVHQQRSLNRLRRENTDFRQRLAEKVQSQRPLRPPAVDPEEIARLRTEHDELLRLRSEVGSLRRSAGEAGTPQASGANGSIADDQSATVQPQRWLTGQFVAAEHWSDAGNQSADSSLETFLWAGRTGNFDRMLQLLTWQIDGIEAADPEVANEMTRAVADMMEFSQKIKGLTLVHFKPVAKDFVWIDIKARNESGDETQMRSPFRLTDRGCK